MQDYEKLGVFYLGKTHNLKTGKVEEEPVLFKSKDLTTHGVIIGMTGSGKTGLGIGLLEEAALDHIPVIAIDPKGDLTNLALTFPELRPEDFQPWINGQEAANKGVTPEEYAAAQAELWKKGLASWDQDGERIRKLKDSAGVTVYTPGSSSGRAVSVLRSFAAPAAALREDADGWRDLLDSTVTGILTLAGLEADPLISREHILLSGILDHMWRQGAPVTLSTLIGQIQTPPMDKLGVMDLETVYPAKDRFVLAMRLNNLVASPGFQAWMEGDPLDIGQFLYSPEGKPRISVFSIAHLSDSERMFFVSLLLGEIVAWMRTQPGTSSLRALLYMDEIFGYLPPTATPPSKKPFLTLLKQARAYGLGLVLATQNPVDLDYKALSNAGTWFIGRLQTERDKERVLAGLEGASQGEDFDRSRTGQILAGLGQRVFYLHSVHENDPRIFQTRWVMSYLAGPLTREQIARLPGDRRTGTASPENSAGPESAGVAAAPVPEAAGELPVLPPEIRQVFLPAATVPRIYRPGVLGLADVHYSSAKYKVEHSRRMALFAPFSEGPVPLDWTMATVLDLDPAELSDIPLPGAGFAPYPGEATQAKSYVSWQKMYLQYLRTGGALTLMYCPELKMISEPGEEERDFRIRLQHAGHEFRDLGVEKIRQKYASRLRTLEDRLRRARQTVERQSSQASQKKLDAAVSAGSALLGALFGNRKLSATSVSKVGTALKSAGRAAKSGGTVEQAKETLEALEQQMLDLENQLQQEVEAISGAFDPLTGVLEEVVIRPVSTGITVHLLALAWAPAE